MSPEPTDPSTRIQQALELEVLDSLLQEIGEQEPDSVLWLLMELFNRRAFLTKGQGDELEAAISQSVSELLSCAAIGDLDGYHVTDGRRRPEGDPLERWRGLSVHAFARYWELSQTAALPPPARAVFLQALWELRSLWQRAGLAALPPPIDVLKMAVLRHIEAAEWATTRKHTPATKGLAVAQHWMTAARMATSVQMPDLLAPHLGALRQAQVDQLEEAPHWSLALIEVEIRVAATRRQRHAELVSDARLEELLTTLEDIAGRLDTMGHMQHQEKDLLEVRASIEGLLGRRPDHQLVARRKAEMLEKHARAADSGIIAHMKWKEAAAEFQQAGLRELAAQAKAEARSAIRRAESHGEFHEIIVPVEISQDHVAAVVAPFFDGAANAEEVLQRMSQRLFAPSLEAGIPAARHARSLASQIATTVPMVDDRSLREVVPDTAEQAAHEERRAVVQEVTFLSAVIISELFRRLREECHLDSETLVAAIARSPCVEPDDLPFLRTAVERYLSEDRISAMHVLVPRVEQLVRRILKANGVEITAMRENELRERPFGELLRAAEEAQAMPLALIKLLQATMSEEWGCNWRNRIAHGLATDRDCSEPNVERVLHTALVLARVGDALGGGAAVGEALGGVPSGGSAGASGADVTAAGASAGCGGHEVM